MTKPASTSSSARSLTPGEVVGGAYRVVRTLHEGKQGTVVEVEQIRLGRRFALKTLGAHFAKDVAAQKRLIKEVELLSKLDHPHIVPIVDFNRTAQGEPYLVMELLQGEPLGARLAPGQTFEIQRALTIGSHVASALAAAHAKGICHRSLNPRHVYVTESGGGPFAHVFGLSLYHHLPAAQSGEHALVPSSRYLAYVAPEQKKSGSVAADELGDQYALAVMIYHMLTGAVPEIRWGVMSLFRRGQSPIAPPSGFRSGIPNALDRVILRGLSQDPAGRYAKMSDFAAALLEAGRNYFRRSFHGVERPSTPPSAPVSGTRSADLSLTPTGFPTSHSSVPPKPTSDRHSAPSSLTGELALLEDLIRVARTAPIQMDAVNAILQLLQKAENTMSTQVERRVSDNHRVFEEILQRYLGGSISVLEVRSIPENHPELTPKRAFLLSCIDGVTTTTEVVQLSPLPRLETLANLAAMMRSGILRAKS